MDIENFLGEMDQEWGEGLHTRKRKGTLVLIRDSWRRGRN